jgi:branched-chain amino acid transport system ATP-binding protein
MSELHAIGITVQFGGHMAVNDASIDVESGVITGLIGPNGAGKTTIFNALCGLQSLSSGRVELDGVSLDGLAPHRRARMGLARTFQRLELFTSLTTRENIQVAAEYRAGLSGDDIDPVKQVDDAISFVGLDEIAETRTDALSTGQARLVELARALVTRPKVLLLDEPASGLDATETGAFTEILRALATSGVGILVVEHDMGLVMSTCETIHVLDFGRIIAVGSPEEIQQDEAVLEAYLGAPEAAT